MHPFFHIRSSNYLIHYAKPLDNHQTVRNRGFVVVVLDVVIFKRRGKKKYSKGQYKEQPNHSNWTNLFHTGDFQNVVSDMLMR